MNPPGPSSSANPPPSVRDCAFQAALAAQVLQREGRSPAFIPSGSL